MAKIVLTFWDDMSNTISTAGISETGTDNKKACLDFSADCMELDFDEIELLQGWLDWVKNDYLELDFDEIELLQGWLDWVKNDYLERVNE